jgi:hypothetical protein
MGETEKKIFTAEDAEERAGLKKGVSEWEISILSPLCVLCVLCG